jgi:hypothetical protein
MILDQLVYRYVAEMVSRKSSFEKRTVKRMQDDEQAIHDFFVKVLPHFPSPSAAAMRT